MAADDIDSSESISDFVALLRHLDDGEDEVPDPKANPAAAFRFVYDGWVKRGGQERGKRRHSVRQIKDWLGTEQVASLETKLAGKTWLQRSDSFNLLRLFLSHWSYDTVRGDYTPYVSADELDVSTKSLLDDLFPAGEKALLLPERSRKAGATNANDQETAEAPTSALEQTTPTRDAIPNLFAQSDILITVSRARAVIGGDPTGAMKAFHDLVERLYRTDGADNRHRALIWIIDFGLRNDKESARAAIYNFYFLIAQFRAIALIRRDGRDEFYAWLLNNVCIIVGSLMHQEIDRIYAEIGIKLPKAQPDLLWLQSDRLFLESIPQRWIDAEGSSAFGRKQRDLWRAPTITAHLKLDDWQPDQLMRADDEADIRQNLRYLLHGEVTPKPSDPDEPVVRCIDLPEPGSRWSDAYRAAVQAALGRLDRPFDKRVDGVKPEDALATLRSQHFAVLRLQEALNLTDMLIDQSNSTRIID